MAKTVKNTHGRAYDRIVCSPYDGGSPSANVRRCRRFKTVLIIVILRVFFPTVLIFTYFLLARRRPRSHQRSRLLRFTVLIIIATLVALRVKRRLLSTLESCVFIRVSHVFELTGLVRRNGSGRSRTASRSESQRLVLLASPISFHANAFLVE